MTIKLAAYPTSMIQMKNWDYDASKLGMRLAFLGATLAGLACSSGEPRIVGSSSGGADAPATDASVGGANGSLVSSGTASGGATTQAAGGAANNAGDSSLGQIAGSGGNGFGGSLATGTVGGNTSTPDATLDGSSADAESPDGSDEHNARPVVLSEDGGWCWFESPRAVIVGNKLVVGSVASGWADRSRRGDINAIVHDLDSGVTDIVELHDQLELDDHDSAAFLVRPDGRLLSLYGKHGGENKFYYRISEPTDALHWGAEQTFSPSATSAVTYSNIYRLTSENDRIYDFFRGLDGNPKPSFVYSDNLGQDWNRGNIVVNANVSSQRPYVRYASNARDTVHLVYTDGHPRDVNNSLYHIYYRDGSLFRSDGTIVSPLAQGLESPSEGTLIFRGDADNVAWVSDVVLDDAEHPVTAYSVQVGSAGLPAGLGGDDIRYRYARWDGTTWHDYPLAYAGTRLYAAEDDYSGLVVVDPLEPSTVYLSTNADPLTGLPLVSNADNKRHYEIFQAHTGDGGQSWHFRPVTADSNADNLRPVVVVGGTTPTRVLLWLRGQYRTYTDYQQEVVALIGAGTSG